MKAPHLNDLMRPAQGKPWSCYSCKLYQYAPCFGKSDIEKYHAKLDPERWESKNKTFRLEVDAGPAEVMLVLDHPVQVEDSTGEPFASAGNRAIRSHAACVGLDAKTWHWAYLARCYPALPLTLAQTTYCTRFLAEDIVKVKPKVIVTFGQMPLNAILGKNDARIEHFVANPQNAVVSGHECVVFPMQAPWYIQKNDHLTSLYVEHFEKLAKFLRGETAVKVDLSEKSIIETPDEAIELCQRFIEQAVTTGKVVEADLETSGLNPYKLNSRISVLSLAFSARRGYAIMYDHNDCPWTSAQRKRVIAEGIRPLLTHPEVKLRWHNGKFDVKWVRQHFGFWPRDQIEDTMLTHYAVDENVEHGLKPLSLMLTDMGDYDEELDKYLRTQGLPDSPRYDLVPKELLGKYAAMDTVATRKLADALKPMANDQDEFVRALAYKAMPAFSATLARMEHNGVAIDIPFTRDVMVPYLKTEAAKSYDEILAQQTVRQFIRDKEQEARQKYIDGLKGTLNKKTGERKKKYTLESLPPPDTKQYFNFSLGSANQLRELFFDARYYRHPIVKTTDDTPLNKATLDNASTDKEVLTDLAAMGSPIARAIQDFRLDEKMVGTYGEPIIARLVEQGEQLLHGDFLLHGTKTGRLSSRNPNLQNQPNKTGGLIKRGFVSRYGDDGVFLQIDFSQIELRVLAAVSGDPMMIEAYRTGKDLHMLTACMIFGLTEHEFHALPKDEQKRRRTVAKRVNFGIAYGIGAPGIQHTLKSDRVVVTEDEARSYLSAFYDKYPRVTAWIDKIERSTSADAFSRSLFGRRRRLLEIMSSDNELISRAKRQAVNHVIQSTAGDLTMTALALYDQEVCLRAGRNPALIHPTVGHMPYERDDRWKRVHPILQVHDMIGVDCHKDVATDATDRLIDIMQNVADYAPLVWGDCVIKKLAPLKKVPILAEAEVGPNWRDAVKVKSGKDIPHAMAVARKKQKMLDANPRYEWGEKDENGVKDNDDAYPEYKAR